MTRRKIRRHAAAIFCVLLAATTACSSSDHTSRKASTSSTSPGLTTTPTGQAEPAADLSREIRGDTKPFIGSAAPTDLKAVGYVEHEYVAAGTATSYRARGEPPRDGRWTFAAAASAPFRTRVLVRRPTDTARFSGTVVVEWLNVSGGVDADPEWASVHEELVRAGDAWVGVSAQRIGVMGGPVLVKVDAPGAEAAGKGLRKIDAARYGELTHPGDGFSYDIFTQVARAIRSGAATDGARPQRVIAAGESQSAFALVTYYNGVQPLTHAFDGFFVHSRGVASLPLVAPGKYADIAGSLGGAQALFRTDQDVPVLDVQTETDVASVLNSYAVRQPDSDRFRLWEVVGTAHADAHLIGSTAKTLDCGVPINNGPMHLVAKAALRALTTWIETGKAPVVAPRIDVAPGPIPQIVRNADGLARGGIRTPPVDVPVSALSGKPGPNPTIICLLLGSSTPLPAARLAQLYTSRSAYVQRYDAAADATIAAGFVLPEDRPALLAFAEPSRIAK